MHAYTHQEKTKHTQEIHINVKKKRTEEHATHTRETNIQTTRSVVDNNNGFEKVERNVKKKLQHSRERGEAAASTYKSRGETGKTRDHENQTPNRTIGIG